MFVVVIRLCRADKVQQKKTYVIDLYTLTNNNL